MAACVCGESNFTERKCLTCNNCKRAIHLECAELFNHQTEEIYTFYCQICSPYTGPSILKTITNTHRHNRNEENAEMLPIQTGTPDFVNYLKNSTPTVEAKQSDVKRMRGQQLTLKDLVISGFDKPILIDTKDGLEIMTDPSFDFQNILSYYSPDYLIEASEVTRHVKVRMKFSHFVDQLLKSPSERQDIYSTILNISKNVKLCKNFLPPRIVRKLSWVDMYWPNVPFKPQLSKYCIISMENSYSEFHIDFGASSAWHHIIHGEQIFYLIEPSEANLSQFEKWITSAKTAETMFFINSEKVFKVKVSAGETIFIPNGWIYSTLSTQDSMVFCGYFLHSLNITTQVTINDFLRKLNKPELQFPSYELTSWYAAPNILKLAKDSFKNQPPKHLSEGIEMLVEKLRYWLHKSKSKRTDSSNSQSLVPKAVNCSKIIRDLSHCLRKKKKAKKAKEENESKESETPTTSRSDQPSAPPPPPPPSLQLNPEETKIKDLVKDLDTDSSSNLKLKLNIKLAQDVIRRSMDDPYDLNTEQNGRELMLLDTKRPMKLKHKRRTNQEELEIAKMIETSRAQDDDYIYLKYETPEENKQAMKSSHDKAWQPSSSGSSSGGGHRTKPKKIKSASTGGDTPAKTSKGEKHQSETNDHLGEKSTKKHKKGLATPKQRLAKKLKMSM